VSPELFACDFVRYAFLDLHVGLRLCRCAVQENHRMLLLLLLFMYFITGTVVFCRVMTSGREVVVTLRSTGCKGQDNEVNFLEHVILSIDMSYNRRGDLQILLTSPAGEQMRIHCLLP